MRVLAWSSDAWQPQFHIVVVSEWSCLAGAADGAPRVGQPGWACEHMPASPVLPLEGAGRGFHILSATGFVSLQFSPLHKPFLSNQ